MGQVALGIRSLLIRIGVLFLLATLMAWILGGSLWPRPVVVDWTGVRTGEQTWNLRLSVESDRSLVRWMVMRGVGADRVVALGPWEETTGIVTRGGGVWVAGRADQDTGWVLWRLDSVNNEVRREGEYSDRLEVELALSRVEVGEETGDAER